MKTDDMDVDVKTEVKKEKQELPATNTAAAAAAPPLPGASKKKEEEEGGEKTVETQQQHVRGEKNGSRREEARETSASAEVEGVPGTSNGSGASAKVNLEKTPERKKLLKKAVSLTVNPHYAPLQLKDWGINSPHSPLDATPKKRKCNCKQSRCLKLYCECFASGIYCDGCNCQDCCNNKDHEQIRQEAVEATLERNPDAFRPKIQSMSPGMSLQDSLKHNKGCNCKRSHCLKRYCECFQAGIYCSENCRCVDCKNYEGSSSRMQLMQSPSSRLQSGSQQDFAAGLSPRVKRSKQSRASTSGVDTKAAAAGNGDALGARIEAIQTQLDNGVGGLSGQGKQQGVQMIHPFLQANAGFSPMVNQMLMPRSLLAGKINENVVKHLTTLLFMVAKDKEEQFKRTAEQNKSNGGDATNKSEPELSDTVTENSLKDEQGDSGHLERALLCEEEPQGLFDLESPKGYSLNKGKGSDQHSLPMNGSNANAAASGSENQQDSLKSQSFAPSSALLPQASVSKGSSVSQMRSGGQTQVYVEQEKAILQELNNCLQVVSQIGRQHAEYFRFLLSPVMPVQHMLSTPSSAAPTTTQPEQQQGAVLAKEVNEQ